MKPTRRQRRIERHAEIRKFDDATKYMRRHFKLISETREIVDGKLIVDRKFEYSGALRQHFTRQTIRI